jgi:hypothetical protein
MDLQLAKKGKNEPRAGIVAQGTVHVGLGEQHADELAAAGWPVAHTALLKQQVAKLEEDGAGRAEAQDASRAATDKEHAAVDEAKRVIRRLRNALPIALRSAPEGVTMQAFASGKLYRTTKRIREYLSDIRPSVEKLDAALAPFFESAYPGLQPSAVVERARKALEGADQQQEVGLKGLPAKTVALYEVKGRVLQLIEDMNRVARIAFDGDAALLGKFNKDILLRARKKRAAGGPETPEQAEEAAVDEV